MSAEHTIIGRRVSELDDPIEGSLKITCANCRALTWVSPSSFVALGGGARVICKQCVPPDAFDAGVQASPGALEEIEARGGPKARSAAEVALQHFNEMAARRRRSR